MVFKVDLKSHWHSGKLKCASSAVLSNLSCYLVPSYIVTGDWALTILQLSLVNLLETAAVHKLPLALQLSLFFKFNFLVVKLPGNIFPERLFYSIPTMEQQVALTYDVKELHLHYCNWQVHGGVERDHKRLALFSTSDRVLVQPVLKDLLSVVARLPICLSSSCSYY